MYFNLHQQMEVEAKQEMQILDDSTEETYKGRK